MQRCLAALHVLIFALEKRNSQNMHNTTYNYSNYNKPRQKLSSKI